MGVSQTRRLTAVTSLTVLASVVSAQTNTPRHIADSPAFLAKESAVRHDFLLRHPTTLPGPLAKYTAKASEAELFPYAFAVAMKGTATAPEKTAAVPSYWKRTSITMARVNLPFGESIAAAYEKHENAKQAQENLELINQHALESIRFLAALVVSGGIADASTFQAATPAIKVRFIAAALKSFAESVGYPCPYTVYLLDVDKDSADDPEHRIGREFVARLNTRVSADYRDWDRFSREQQTAALERAFQAFTARGAHVAETGSTADLEEYLERLGAHINKGHDWVLVRDREFEADREIVRQVFGSAALADFEKQPEGAEKDRTRVAAVLMVTQFQILASGLLQG